MRAELRHVSHSVLDEGEQTPAEMYEACRCTYHLYTAPHPHVGNTQHRGPISVGKSPEWEDPKIAH